jgi:hypothetical protein
MHDPHRVADDLGEHFNREEAERLATFVWWIEHRGRVDREQVEEFLSEVFTAKQAKGLAEVAGYRSE